MPVVMFTVNPVSSYVSATGGTISYINVSGTYYKVHTFTSSGTLTFTKAGPVEYLLVAGGGAGGGNRNGGGGGAGGLLTGTTSVTASDYTIIIGSGGVGTAAYGGNGGNSTALGLTAIGGGGGAYNGGGLAGGSGGGGGKYVGTGSGGGGTVGQGNSGGSGSSSLGGGGGGGASAAGFTFTGIGGGAGGAGLSSSISGTTTFYAGGGGGGVDNYFNIASPAGVGGVGGGGAGAYGYSGGSAATPGTGGGGGGTGVGGAWGGNGGSGIFIVRYPVEVATATLRASSCYQSSSNSYRMTFSNPSYAYDEDSSTCASLVSNALGSMDGGAHDIYLTGFPAMSQTKLAVTLTVVYRMYFRSFNSTNDWAKLYYTTDGSTYTVLDAITASVTDTGIKTQTFALSTSVDTSKVAFYMEGRQTWDGSQFTLSFYDAKLDITYNP